MSAKGHRWLGRWERQRCANCGALRSSKGISSPSAFSTDRGLTWTAKMPDCKKEHQ